MSHSWVEKTCLAWNSFVAFSDNVASGRLSKHIELRVSNQLRPNLSKQNTQNK